MPGHALTRCTTFAIGPADQWPPHANAGAWLETKVATPDRNDPPARKPARREHIPLGILYMLGATILFSGSSASAKWLVAIYPFGEVLFVRQFTSLVTCALLILPFSGIGVFYTSRLRHHAGRAVAQGTAQILIIVALMLLPLASAMAINFSAPLFSTLVAALMLRERVGMARWAALLIGFGGVLIITEPGVGTFQAGSMFALGNAMLYGSVAALVRGMSATESADTLIMYQMVFLTIFFIPLLPFGFTVPTVFDGTVLLLTGIANAFGQYWWTRALSLAPASAVTPFYYFTLVWSMVLGLLVWGDVPSMALLSGSAIVVGSGLFLLWRESGRKRAASS
jgi:drug/metabolite transporter (DMT)-like permease